MHVTKSVADHDHHVLYFHPYDALTLSTMKIDGIKNAKERCLKRSAPKTVVLYGKIYVDSNE